MIAIGIDPHMKTHTAVAIEAATGVVLEEVTVTTDGTGHDRLLSRTRTLGSDRYFAVEDCRHVSGRLVGQTAGASRFKSEAACAMHVDTAPLPVSSGKSDRSVELT